MFRRSWAIWTLVWVSAAGCLRPTRSEVVVYSALDQEFSEPIFDRFEKETGIVVRAKFDTESTKTVGLAEALLAERTRPRCDVFWNNEILHTLRLNRQGLWDVYRPPVADSYPAMVRAADGSWHGFAARARVLIVNTDRVSLSERPTSILALADARWRGRAAIAKPLFGTTATHAACLFSLWGETRAHEFFRNVKQNARILSGNKQVAQAVAAGQFDFGVTDTDDAIIELEQGMPVAIIYPDQGPGEMGTLFIPNTLAILRNAPNPQSARRLVDYLLSPKIEQQLAEGRSAQIPLNENVTIPVRTETPQTVRAMQIDFQQAADQWEPAAAILRDLFSRG